MSCEYDVSSNRPIDNKLLQVLEGYNVYNPTKRLDAEEAWNIARRSRVFINRFMPITKEMLEDPGCLELIIVRSSGFDHVDITMAREVGVCVANQPEIITEAVAEYAVGGVLAAYRQIVARHNSTREWSIKGWPIHLAGFLVRGRTLGLLGSGRIGQSIALKLKGLGVSKILYYSRSRKPALEALGAMRVPLEELFEHSDILVNSLPLSNETRGIVTYELLKRLPRWAVYVNIGRGGTEEPGAIERVARERSDLFFVLDVHPVEPLPKDHKRLEFLDDPRFVIAPHMAGASHESRVGTTLLALLQARDYLRYGCIWNPVIQDCRRCEWGPPSIDKIIELTRTAYRDL
ncbi:MAG: 2-hydroxyacid dehydrogenase [Desulfurococcales archaeon]|nr:2-hydroxyacid dehydrogenase [Desulfurococcales archaeon]